MSQVFHRLFLIVTLTFAQLSLASGWRCTDEPERWSVKLYNHTHPTLGTTNPSQFIVRESGKTIVHRFSPHIDFISNSKGTTYRTTDLDGTYGCVFNFHIGFREGVDSVPHGTRRMGKLFLTSCDDGDETTHDLECHRYLKNP